MTAGKILNTSHPIYSRVKRALSLDTVLPKLRALDGGLDGALISDKTPSAALTTWTSQQGIARTDTHWYAMNTATIRKYDLSNNLIASNDTPFVGLPAGMNHCGDGFAHGDYLYCAVSEWVSPDALNVVIAKYLLTDLTLDSYFDTFATVPECGGSGCCLSPDGTEILAVSFHWGVADDNRNKDIHRFNLTTGAANGKYTVDVPSVGIQGIATDGTDYYLSSWRSGAQLYNGIYRYDSNFKLKSILRPELTGEIEGIEFYDSTLYYHIKTSGPKSLSYEGAYDARDSRINVATKAIDSSLITDSGTVLIKIGVGALYNFNSFIDCYDYPQDWEGWVYNDGRMAWRIKNAQQSIYNGTTASTEYIIALSWTNTSGTVVSDLGVDGVYQQEKTTTWVTPPTSGLYLNGVNRQNTYGDNVYYDVLLIDGALNDSELDLYAKPSTFDDFYSPEDAPVFPSDYTRLSTRTSRLTYPS